MIWQISVFVIGLCVGSFLNVCIFRIPRKESIVSPGSRCPGCGKVINVWDNIPVLSYVWLKGRCRQCGMKISPRYPLVEILTVFLGLGLLYRFGPTLEALLYFLWVCVLLVITFIDIDYQIIPDDLSLGALGAGLILVHWLPISYKDALWGLVLGAGIPIAVIYTYLFLMKKQAMGGGDVKLLGMIGVFIGWKGVLFTLFSASLVGSVVGITWLVLTKKSTQSPIPFGPFLSLGAILYVFWGSFFLNWYIHLMNPSML